MSHKNFIERNKAYLTRDFWHYFVWWLGFGVIGSVSKPIIVETGGPDYWSQLFQQFLFSMFFFSICGLIFIYLQNRFNPDRKTSLKWVFGIGVWMIMKFVFLGIGYFIFGLVPVK